MTPFHHRPAEQKDLDALNDLLKISKGYWGYPDSFMTAFMKNLSLTADVFETSTIVMVYIDDKLGGFYSFTQNEDQEIELAHFYLHPDFMGQGWGRKIWNFACETAHQNGWKEFLVWSDPNANEFYEKMGCKLTRFQRSSLEDDRYQAVYKARVL